MIAVTTRASLATFWGAAVLAVLALLFQSPSTLALAGSLLIALVAAWAMTIPTVQRLRKERLEVACRVVQTDPQSLASTVVPGMPFRIECTFRHRGPLPLRVEQLVATLPSDVSVIQDAPAELWVPPGVRTDVTLTLAAKAAGRIVMQGIAVNVPGPFGLFAAPLYFPHPLAVKVVPRTAFVRSLGTDSASGGGVERSGRTLLRRHGGGTELRELRDMQRGDPFKSIAWKPSARAGRLLVREAEREVQRTHCIVLDVSGSMRGGEPGRRKLDFALELAAVEARRSLDRGDRVALITVDGRVLANVTPNDGMQHLIAIYDALLAATEVVDLDLTDADDDQVLDIVGKYLRQQDAIDLSTADGWRRDAVLAHVRRALINDPEPRPAIVAGDHDASRLRQFCRQRGIPLPYRPDTRADGKGGGLARALRLAGGDSRMPRLITLVTDLDGVRTLDVLRRPLIFLRAMRHNVVIVYPEPEVGTPRTDNERAWTTVVRLQHERRRQEAKAFFGKLGVPLVFAPIPMSPAQVVARASVARKVA